MHTKKGDKVSGEDMTIHEVMQVVVRDKDYYDRTGGGVTFSGGEALMQAEALEQLLNACHEEGIHTAIETTGNVSLTVFQRIVAKTDLLLFDIKHTNAERLKEVTGGNWGIIRQNLESVSQQKVVLRVPCIPAFNLTENFFGSLYDLARELGISRIDLLPYHTLGRDKYEQLGMYYTAPAERLDKKILQPYCEEGIKRGLNVRIE